MDSDTLSEKLKAAYPEYQTHRERKHQAAIDFLNEELHRMQTRAVTKAVCTTETMTTTIRPRHDSYTPLMEVLPECDDVSTVSSRTTPFITDASTPPKLSEKGIDEPLEEDMRVTRLTSNPANKQHFIWSAHDGRPMQPKTKRKMTLEERSAYKETRKRGACEKCRRQKGKVLASYSSSKLMVDPEQCTHLNESGEPNSAAAGQSPKRRKVAT